MGKGQVWLERSRDIADMETAATGEQEAKPENPFAELPKEAAGCRA